MPVFKLWSGNRLKKKTVVANSCADLLEKAQLKFELEEVGALVLEEDGTEIEEDEVLMEFRQSTLMILKPGEQWQSRSEPAGNANLLAGPTAGGDQSELEGSQQVNHVDQGREEKSSQSIELRVSTGTPLPSFSQRVLKHLEMGMEYVVWNDLISECANYYISNFPNINNSTEYSRIGQRMFNTYPTIQREGEQKWSFFTKCLSQRIRHIRWAAKKKTKPTQSSQQGQQRQTGSNEGAGLAKRARCAQISQGTEHIHLSDDDLEQSLAELGREWGKGPDKRCIGHVELLLQKTFKENQKWIRSLPDAQVEPIIKRIPCYADANMIFHDFKKLRGTGLPELRTAVDRFMTAVENLMGDESEGPLRMLPVMKYAEKKTAFDKGKGRKTESVISVKEDIPDDDVIAHLSSSEKQPPRLIVFLTENKLTGCFIATDKVHIQCENDISSALLQLVSAYYVFNLEYPKTYSQLLGLFQARVLHDPYLGNKSAKYKTFETLLLRHLKFMDSMEME